MNERFRNNNLPTAQQVVECMRHRALQSPQAAHLAEYVAKFFKTTGSSDMHIGYGKYGFHSDKADWLSMGFVKIHFEDITCYKRENGRYLLRGGDRSAISEWRDVTDTIIPCKYATDYLDLNEKYFILTSLGYDVRFGVGEIFIRLPQVKYSYI